MKRQKLQKRNRQILQLNLKGRPVREIAEKVRIGPDQVYKILRQSGKGRGGVRSKIRRTHLEILSKLQNPAGRRRVTQVMRKASRQRRLWEGGRLRTSLVLEELGFPIDLKKPLCEYGIVSWQGLVEGGLVRFSRFLEVVLFYGLRIKNPEEYLRKLYLGKVETTLKDLEEFLRVKTERKGVLPPSQSVLQRYFGLKGILGKPPGSHRIEVDLPKLEGLMRRANLRGFGQIQKKVKEHRLWWAERNLLIVKLRRSRKIKIGEIAGCFSLSRSSIFLILRRSKKSS